MSYIIWRKKHEDEYLRQVNNEIVIPAFSNSSNSKELENITSFVMEQIISKEGMTIISFPTIFAEYLYEEYHVTPADIEIMCQTIFNLFFKDVETVASNRYQQMLYDMFRNEENEGEEYDSNGDGKG